DGALEKTHLALRCVVVARHAYRIDQADAELAGHDCGRHQAAAGDGNDGVERPGIREPPSERARIAVKLVPRDRKRLLRRQRHGQRKLSTKSNLAVIASPASATASSSARL